jgi:hypothetical protein
LFARLRVEVSGWVRIDVGVRFEGESGFDAASVDETGATREFYADVVEALLSCYHIAGAQSPNLCPSIVQLVDDCSSGDECTLSSRKLPLWILDD